MPLPHDVIGTAAPTAPPQYPCDGCTDAFLSMCGTGWTTATLTFECGGCGTSVRYVHLCPRCSYDPVETVKRILEPGCSHDPPVEAPAPLRLVENG